MKALSPLYFPDTIIDSTIGLPLASCFETIYCLCPIDDLSDTTLESSTDPFMDTDFCQVHIPCPLTEEDRQGFVHLLKEIRTHGSDFIDQLKMMTLASITDHGRQRAESSGGILSALFAGTESVKKQEDKKTALELWQARLLLKLAEIIDREEKQLSEQMSSIDTMQTEMLSNLQGKGDGNSNDPSLSKLKAQTKPLSSITENHRFRAWLTLFSHWASDEIPVWISHRKSAVEGLFETYEKMSNRGVEELFSLSLPALGTDTAESGIKTLNEFRKRTVSLHAQMDKQLNTLLVNGNIKKPDWPDAEWQQAIDDFFPQPDYSRATLTFYLLSGISFTQLMGRSETENTSAGNSVLCTIEPTIPGE